LVAIETNSLTKTFGTIKAVDGVSLTVEDDEIFGFLGPNGAGKSTTMMILTTLLKPTSGRAIVAGFDVVKQPKKVRQNIGFVQQEIAVDEYLTGRENLILQGRLNHIPLDILNSRIDEVLDMIELKNRQNDPVLTFSGGMRKRLDIASGLLHRPRILFLDEPTVGLDTQTRRKIWEYIRRIHKEFNMTIFLSTHYMEEADKLCDRIAIIDYGRIQAVDSPTNLKEKIGNEIISFKVLEGERTNELLSNLKEISLIKDIAYKNEQISIYTSKGTELIPLIFQISSKLGIKLNSISITQPTLDDVFLSYTGHELRDETEYHNKKFDL
jgi:ABC-2 type transport system ATP-binding protein